MRYLIITNEGYVLKKSKEHLVLLEEADLKALPKTDSLGSLYVSKTGESIFMIEQDEVPKGAQFALLTQENKKQLVWEAYVATLIAEAKGVLMRQLMKSNNKVIAWGLNAIEDIFNHGRDKGKWITFDSKDKQSSPTDGGKNSENPAPTKKQDT